MLGSSVQKSLHRPKNQTNKDWKYENFDNRVSIWLYYMEPRRLKRRNVWFRCSRFQPNGIIEIVYLNFCGWLDCEVGKNCFLFVFVRVELLLNFGKDAVEDGVFVWIGSV